MHIRNNTTWICIEVDGPSDARSPIAISEPSLVRLLFSDQAVEFLEFRPRRRVLQLVQVFSIAFQEIEFNYLHI